MRILITGITGFVGSHLADYTIDKAEVWGLKRWRSPTSNIEHILDKLSLIDGDLKDLSFCIQMLKKIKPDKIFHLAAQSFVDFSFTNPIETLQDNVMGTANLLEAIRLTEQDPLIHICSSSEVYGQVKETPITEDSPFNPASPYGVSTVAEDMLGLMYYTAYGLKTVRTRMFTHTGPRRGEVFVCSKFAKQIAERERYGGNIIYSKGNLDSIRTFADVRDTVRAYWMLRDDMAGEVYNIGGDTTMTCRQMLTDLLTISKLKNWHIDDKPTERPAEVTLQVPDCTKFKKATGWKPMIPFSQTLLDLLNYWREWV